MTWKQKNKQTKIFCDFDGTITTKDLGDEIFKVFGQFEPYHSQLVNGDMGIKEYWKNMVPTLKDTTIEQIQDYAVSMDIDAYFQDFLSICKKNEYQLFIVSDGFMTYIEPVMQKMNAEDIQVFANKINFSDNPNPEFHGASESCTCLCASCKRNIVLNNSSDEDLTVYIGDGYSDFCAAEHCDIIFAKKKLAAYCNQYRIPFYTFKSFFDIIKIFDNLHNGKLNFNKRRQAELKRKQAYEVE